MSVKKSYTLLLTAVLVAGAAVIPLTQAEQEEAPVQIPATAAAVWESIDQHVVSLNKLIQSGTLKEVHHQAFAIRDLTAALPDRMGTLSSDTRNQIETQVKFVKVLATRLDESGDSNDRSGAKADLVKLRGVLKSMRSLSAASSSK